MSLRYEPPPQMPISDKEKTDWIRRKWIFGFYKKIDVQEAWIAPTHLNSWANFDGGYNEAGYMKDSLGFVHLRGSIKSGTPPSVAFTLPSGYRPVGICWYPLARTGGTGKLQIQVDGDGYIESGSGKQTSLDGITFKAA